MSSVPPVSLVQGAGGSGFLNPPYVKGKQLDLGQTCVFA
jgi:hypothetical protein